MPPTLTETVKALFRKYDFDESGCIEKGEFVTLFTVCGLSEEQASKLFEVVDLDCDEGVDVEEFLNWLLGSGKDYYALDADNMFTDSHTAASRIRALGEAEAITVEEDQEKIIKCCEMAWRRAEVFCDQCNKYYCWDGFKLSHTADGSAIEMRGHTTTVVWVKPAVERSDGDKYRRMAEQEVQKELDRDLRKELVWELTKQFAVYDLDGGGTLSMDEMTKVAVVMSNLLEENKPEEEIRKQVYKTFKNLDVDHNGDVELQEFIQVICEELSVGVTITTLTKRAKELTELMVFAMNHAGVTRKKKTAKKGGRKKKMS